MENGFEKALKIIKRSLDEKVSDYNASEKVEALVEVFARVVDAYIEELKKGQNNE